MKHGLLENGWNLFCVCVTSNNVWEQDCKYQGGFELEYPDILVGSYFNFWWFPTLIFKYLKKLNFSRGTVFKTCFSSYVTSRKCTLSADERYRYSFVCPKYRAITFLDFEKL